MHYASGLPEDMLLDMAAHCEDGQQGSSDTLVAFQVKSGRARSQIIGPVRKSQDGV